MSLIKLKQINPQSTASGSIPAYNGSSVLWSTVGGDLTASASGSTLNLTLASVGTAGTYGSATQVPIITTDAKGRVLSVSTTTLSSTNQNITISGDASGSGTTAITLTLASVGTAGTYGSGSLIPTITVNAKGLVTGVSTSALTLPNVGTAGTYGSATQIPVFVTDANGRITSVTNTTLSSTNQNITISGDASGSGTTAITLTLASVGTAGTYGSASTVPVITTDAKGRVTAVTNTAIAVAGTAVTGNISGNAANVTGTVAIGNGGTGQTTASAALTALGGVANAGTTPSIGSGTFSAIPAAGTAGRLYVATDTLALYRDSGSAWVLVDPAYTGDITKSAGATTTTLASVGTAGTYGSATQVPVITTDAKGRVIAVTTATITGGGGTAARIQNTANNSWVDTSGTNVVIKSNSGTTAVEDSSSANIILFENGGSSAVNYFTLSNAPTNTDVSFAAVGSDTSVFMDLSPQGLGRVRVGSGSAGYSVLESVLSTDLYVKGGDNATTAGNNLNLTGGTATGASGAGGNVNISGGSSANGAGGLVQLQDANNNNVLTINGYSNSVNYFAMFNSPSTFALELLANGSDTNISIGIGPKGTGQILAPNTYVPSTNYALVTKTYVDTSVAAVAATVTQSYSFVLGFGGSTTGLQSCVGSIPTGWSASLASYSTTITHNTGKLPKSITYIGTTTVTAGALTSGNPPTVTVTATFTASSNQITVSNATGMTIGNILVALNTPALSFSNATTNYLPAYTTITAISGTTITLSNNALASGTTVPIITGSAFGAITPVAASKPLLSIGSGSNNVNQINWSSTCLYTTFGGSVTGGFGIITIEF